MEATASKYSEDKLGCGGGHDEEGDWLGCNCERRKGEVSGRPNDAAKARHRSGRGGYYPFFKPAPPYTSLDFLTRDPPKMPKIRVGFESAGRVKPVWVLQVCRSSFILMVILVILLICLGFF